MPFESSCSPFQAKSAAEAEGAIEGAAAEDAEPASEPEEQAAETEPVAAADAEPER